MAIDIVWDNPEETVLRYDIHETWTWQEAEDAVNTIFKMMDSASAEVICTIPHFTGKIKLPANGMAHFHKLTSRSHPKAGLTVIVGANFVMRSVISTAKHLYTIAGNDVDFDYADTLELARRKINRFMTRMV